MSNPFQFVINLKLSHSFLAYNTLNKHANICLINQHCILDKNLGNVHIFSLDAPNLHSINSFIFKLTKVNKNVLSFVYVAV